MNDTVEKSAIIAAILTTSVLVYADVSSQAEKPMFERDRTRTIGRDEATKEWLKSWHKGEVYMTEAEYLYEAKLETEKNEAVTGGKITKWLKAWFADLTVNSVRVAEKGSFSGKAISKTFVFHEMPTLRLVRDYQYVMSDGTWGGDVVPKSQVVKQAIGKAAEVDALGRESRYLFYNVVGFINPVVGKFLSTWGEAGYEVSADWMKENVGTFDSEGRLNIAEDTLIAKGLGEDERKKVMAMAMQFSDNVNGCKVAIAANGKYHRIISEIKSLKSADADPRASVEAFDVYMRQGSPSNSDIEALIKREAFSMTSDLFDAAVRKPGDVWVVDGAFFNSFLHPDLKGAFRGCAVVRYVEDQEGEDGYYSEPSKTVGMPKRYDIRKIEVVQSGKVDGAMVSTDLVYDERPMGGRFWAKYDSGKSDIFMLVDKVSGHLVFGEMKLNADEVGALPSLSLLDGFKSAGEASLDLTIKGEIVNLDEYKK